MKGPNTLNDLFGVQMGFRSYHVPLVCDIAKMYHSIKTTEVERHHMCARLSNRSSRTKNFEASHINL